MNKIFIVGIVASGKTTLARKLSLERQIPWHELDRIVHPGTDTDTFKRSPEEVEAVIRDIDRQGPWIMEGTDRPSCQLLYELADTVIFLDPPLWKRRIRILTRYAKQKAGVEACRYKPDRAMLKRMFGWTREFERSRPAFEAKLLRYRHKVVRRRS